MGNLIGYYISYHSVSIWDNEHDQRKYLEMQIISKVLISPKPQSFMRSTPYFPPVKPRLVRDNLKIITIKVGKSMSWSVDVIGEPITTKTWTKGESYITKEKEFLIDETHERIKITNSDYNTLFECTDALRRDTCKYKVRAENCNGFDEEWVELCVLGRPARPEGPLEVSNITAEGCKLRWKPPLDDGGCPIRVRYSYYHT